MLGSGPGEKKTVALVSPEAERAGVRPGLPLRELPTSCPEAVVVQPDPVRLAGVLDDVSRALSLVSPVVEPALEDIFLDLRGLGPLYGRVEALERAIFDAVPPLLRPRIGLAAGKFVAAVAAREAAGDAGSPTVCGVLPDDSRAFLAPFPIGHLPLAPDALQRLRLMGLRTIGDLARLPFSAVQAQLGPDGARAWRLANGRDDEPIRPRPHVETVRAALRFEDPIASVDAVMAAVRHLLGLAFADPLLDARSARAARLRALLSDGSSWERAYPFKEPLSSQAAVHAFLKSKLSLPDGLPSNAVEELALDLSGLGGESARQGTLFTAQPQLLDSIAAVARQLGARYGHIPLYHVVEVEPWSRIPERRWALVTCTAA